MVGDIACALALQLSVAVLFLAYKMVFAAGDASSAFFYATAAITYAAFLLLSLATALRDPGTCALPKRHNPERYYGMFYPSRHTAFAARKCLSCDFWLPPGARHCSQCDRCVLFFDHHCAYLGTDIGSRNYLLFCALLCIVLLFYSNAFFCVLGGVIRIVLARKDPGRLPVFSLTLAVPLVYYAAVGTYFGYNMLDYHWYLHTRDLTTSCALKNMPSILLQYRDSLEMANIFLSEFSSPEKHLLVRRLPKALRKQVVAMCMPNLTRLAPEVALYTAWEYAIYLSDIREHLPEKITRYM